MACYHVASNICQALPVTLTFFARFAASRFFAAMLCFVGRAAAAAVAAAAGAVAAPTVPPFLPLAFSSSFFYGLADMARHVIGSHET
jgi:hypothetical protein